MTTQPEITMTVVIRGELALKIRNYGINVGITNRNLLGRDLVIAGLKEKGLVGPNYIYKSNPDKLPKSSTSRS